MANGRYMAANRGSSVPLDVVSQLVQMARRSLPLNRKHVAFYDIQSLNERLPNWFRADLIGPVALPAVGKLQPIIAERLPLEGVVRAHRHVEPGEVHGYGGAQPEPPDHESGSQRSAGVVE